MTLRMDEARLEQLVEEGRLRDLRLDMGAISHKGEWRRNLQAGDLQPDTDEKRRQAIETLAREIFLQAACRDHLDVLKFPQDYARSAWAAANVFYGTSAQLNASTTEVSE